MLRPATPDDLDTLLLMASRMHRENPRYCRLSFSSAKVRALLHMAITSQDAFARVFEHDGRIVGAAIAICDEHWMSDDLVAVEIGVFVESTRRGTFVAARLIDAMDAWASESGAKFLDAGTSTGFDPERTATLYERLGFSRASIGLEKVYG